MLNSLASTIQGQLPVGHPALVVAGNTVVIPAFTCPLMGQLPPVSVTLTSKSIVVVKASGTVKSFGLGQLASAADFATNI